uniref:Uncharacterized protein n=1 Tax=Otolemur garnettii TaxID=30611 RepID=H0XTI0_OTOGA
KIKTNKSKSGSHSSLSRATSRSHSHSFSKSPSRSRSVSHSRKTLSSRSSSRSYSPTHNRERNRLRVYQKRDFRGCNRGYGRPCFYLWGQYNQGGHGNYHSNWQNYQQANSLHWGHSSSQSPKRRSPSARSRRHFRNSDKLSGRSRHSPSSRSSSNHSQVESLKLKPRKEKKSSLKVSRPSEATGNNQRNEPKEQTFSGGTSQDTKASASSKPWPDAPPAVLVKAMARCPTCSAGQSHEPSSESPLQSVVVRQRSPRLSPVPNLSPLLSNISQMGSTVPSGAGCQSGTHQRQFHHGAGSLTPSPKSPLGKTSPATGSTHGSSQKEESAAAGGAAYTKRQVSPFRGDTG